MKKFIMVHSSEGCSVKQDGEDNVQTHCELGIEISGDTGFDAGDLSEIASLKVAETWENTECGQMCVVRVA